MTIQTIRPSEVCDQIRNGASALLIDVRTPLEFSEVHAAGAVNVPLDELDPAAVARECAGDAQPLYVICKSGKRAAKACDALLCAGAANVISVEGGTDAWVSAGLPVIRSEKKVISLERQVRIAAGLIVLIGVILAATVHPWFILLSGFVGAGLVFAGITDFCGMGLLLARAPWNRMGRRCDKGGSCCG